MNILGYRYKVIGVDKRNKNDRVHGECDFSAHVITVRNHLPKDEKESTLVHEGIEAGNHHLGLGLKHQTIMALETCMYQFLTANGVDLSPLLQHIQKEKGAKKKKDQEEIIITVNPKIIKKVVRRKK